MKEFFDIVIKLFGENQLALSFSILFIFIGWLFKEFRNYTIEADKEIKSKIEKALENYFELKLEINKFLNNTSDETKLDSLLPKVYPYLTNDLIKHLSKWIKYKKQSDLVAFNNSLNVEIERLKKFQFSPITNKPGIYTPDRIEFYLKLNFGHLAKPFMLTFVTIVIILILAQFGISIILIKTYTNKIAFSILAAIYILFVTLIIYLVERIMHHRFNNTAKNWIAILIFMITFLLSFKLSLLYRAIIQSIELLLYLIFYYPKCLKNNCEVNIND